MACECRITSTLDPDGDPIGQEIVSCYRHSEVHVSRLEADKTEEERQKLIEHGSYLRMEARVRRVEAALQKYGQHLGDGKFQCVTTSEGQRVVQCFCGLTAALHDAGGRE